MIVFLKRDIGHSKRRIAPLGVRNGTLIKRFKINQSVNNTACKKCVLRNNSIEVGDSCVVRNFTFYGSFLLSNAFLNLALKYACESQLVTEQTNIIKVSIEATCSSDKRIKDRFKITGRGIIYLIEMKSDVIIKIGDVFQDLNGNRFRLSGIEMFHRYLETMQHGEYCEIGKSN